MQLTYNLICNINYFNLISVLTTFVIIGLIWLPFIQSQQQIESSNNQTQNNQYVISKPPITRPSSVQVVIDDDNRMKIEEMPKHQVHKQTLDQDNRSSMTSYFIQGDDLTKNETKQLRKPLMNSEFYEPDVNTETNLQSPKPENRYTNFDESVTPSPGTVSEFMEHFMSGDDQSGRVKFDSTDSTDSSETSSYHSSTTKPLVVPVGSRVHTIHYRDYDGNSVHEEQQFVSPLEKYEPKVIELESSRPILPIVINFHTKSSPVIATQTHYKPPNTVPKVQYFETNEPPHYHRHIVHKPIYQVCFQLFFVCDFKLKYLFRIESSRDHITVSIFNARDTTSSRISSNLCA